MEEKLGQTDCWNTDGQNDEELYEDSPACMSLKRIDEHRDVLVQEVIVPFAAYSRDGLTKALMRLIKALVS